MFSWFRQWNEFENRWIFDEIKAYKKTYKTKGVRFLDHPVARCLSGVESKTKCPKYELREAKMITRQFADKPTRGQSSRGLVNSRINQLAEMFDL